MKLAQNYDVRTERLIRSGEHLRDRGCSRATVLQLLLDQNRGFSIPLWTINVVRIVRGIFGEEA